MKQFLITHFTDHVFYGSIPRKLRNWQIQMCFAIAEHLPWFLRKPAINFLAGREIYYDFQQTDMAMGTNLLLDGWFVVIRW